MLQFSFSSSAIKLKLCMCSSTYYVLTTYRVKVWDSSLYLLKEYAISRAAAAATAAATAAVAA